MYILLICAAAGGLMGLISALRKGLFLPMLVIVVVAVIMTASSWLPLVGVEGRVEGEGLFELMGNFYALLSEQGRLALPAFIAGLCAGRYLGVLIARYKETHGEDPYKKKIRILNEHGLQEFD